MKCVNHPEIDSVVFCGHCGRGLCADCRHEVRGMIYCEDCLAARLSTPGLPPIMGLGAGPSPGVALALGFIPGVGAIYNGQIMKAIVQVLLFGSLIALSNRVPGPMDAIFGLGGAAFYFYMVIDSYQTARAKQFGQPVPEWFGLGEFKMSAPIGAAALIGIGVLFLLDNFGVHVFQHIGKFWPLLLIAVGVMLLQRRVGGGGAPPRSNTEIPGPPPQGPSNLPGPHGL
jgi:TM2 domain-containing membrane protein YozV